jgi:hypothetical protein
MTSATSVCVSPRDLRISASRQARCAGEPRATDWSAAPVFPAGDATAGARETQWVDPGAFFGQLPSATGYFNLRFRQI